jgi:hypothetical protein
MELKTIEAQKVFEQYLRTLDDAVTRLPLSMQKDLRAEISLHIIDSMQASKKGTELDRLRDALDRLGDPDNYLKPMIADYAVEFATSTFQPYHVFRAIVQNIGIGIERTLRSSFFFLLYLTLFLFVFLFVSKIIFPSHTGLFFQNGEFHAFGFVSNPQEDSEQLGGWLFPLAILGFSLDYLLITLLMKLTRKRRK